MRVTVFDLEERVVPRVAEEPAWERWSDFDGKPLTDVARVGLVEVPGATAQLVRIGAGGHFVMHASPALAFCQVVRGRGVLRLPDGTELGYAGPELHLFRPHTLHEWTDVTEETLLSVCEVHDGGA